MADTIITTGAEVIGALLAAAALIRYGIRSYFREKDKHLTSLLQASQDNADEPKDKGD